MPYTPTFISLQHRQRSPSMTSFARNFMPNDNLRLIHLSPPSFQLKFHNFLFQTNGNGTNGSTAWLGLDWRLGNGQVRTTALGRDSEIQRYQQTFIIKSLARSSESRLGDRREVHFLVAARLGTEHQISFVFVSLRKSRKRMLVFALFSFVNGGKGK